MSKKGQIIKNRSGKFRKPYKFDLLKRQQWLNAFKKTGSKIASCVSVGISAQTLYDTFNSPDENDIEFKKKVDEILHLQTEVVENNLFNLTRTHPIAAFFWLCNRVPEKWKNIQRTEISGNADRPLLIEFVPAETPKKENTNNENI